MKSRSMCPAVKTRIFMRTPFVRLLLLPLAAVTSLQIATDAPPGDVSYVQYLLPHTKVISSAAVSVLVAEGIYPPDRISGDEKNKRLELLQQLVKRDTASPKENAQEPAADSVAATLEKQRRRVFLHLDGDGDGQISQAEYFAILGKTEQYVTLFAKEDKDGDLIITLEEFDGPQPSS
eukprot:INCI17633.7.p1 GENE.INCI17633.7~~INCI17633.7.p1  ORF type:complete len:178 (-),score=28.12 INCI17633.7:488-1021(-)